jgi:hypothetical protein
LGTIYVARSKALSQWGYDVGLSKHIYKVGCTESAVKDIVAAGWAGESDWVLVKKQDDVDITEDDFIARVGLREKMIAPNLYPRIRETPGIFKIIPTHVENHFMVSRALAGEPEIRGLKVKHPETAAYLIAIGTS